MRIINSNSRLPNYPNGLLQIYSYFESDSDYPTNKIKFKGNLAYLELDIYEKTRFNYKSQGIELKRKIRIPAQSYELKDLVIKLDNKMYKVLDTSTGVKRHGFVETDLNLVDYVDEWEIIDDNEE